MSAHTPGPWFASYAGDMSINAGDPVQRGSYTTYPISIVGGCGCCGSPFGVDDPDECAANARLIAAAPDLLEALETALDGWQREFEYLAKRTPEWVTEARHAIAKATGEQA